MPATPVIFCPRCGVELEGDLGLVVCTSCGAELEEDLEAALTRALEDTFDELDRRHALGLDHARPR